MVQGNFIFNYNAKMAGKTHQAQAKIPLYASESDSIKPVQTEVGIVIMHTMKVCERAAA
jgi:hypothetical protein